MNRVHQLRERAAAIYGLRDQIGAIKDPVYFLSRVWRTAVGVGAPVDNAVRITPQPYVETQALDEMVSEHGEVIGGEFMLRGLVLTYTKAQVSLVPPNDLTEVFYFIDGDFFVTTRVVKNYLSWDVTITKAKGKQKTYFPEGFVLP